MQNEVDYHVEESAYFLTSPRISCYVSYFFTPFFTMLTAYISDATSVTCYISDDTQKKL